MVVTEAREQLQNRLMKTEAAGSERLVLLFGLKKKELFKMSH